MIKDKIFSNHLKRDVKYLVKMSKEETDTYLYFFDAQNLYDKEESAYGHIWDVQKVIDDMNLSVNVVAIYSLGDMDRVAEYQPFPVENHEMIKESFDHKGHLTGKFIVEELIEKVEDSPAKKRIILGSSMGGVMALYMGQKYPQIFNGVCAMSTAGYFAPQSLAKSCASYDPKNKQKVYMDCGTKETDQDLNNIIYLLSNRMLAGAVSARVADCKYIEGKDHIHNESFWHQRLYGALEFLLWNKAN